MFLQVCLLALLFSCVHCLLINSAQLLNSLSFSYNAKSLDHLNTRYRVNQLFLVVYIAYVLNRANEYSKSVLDYDWDKIPQLLPETARIFLSAFKGLIKHWIKEKEGNSQLVQQCHCCFLFKDLFIYPSTHAHAQARMGEGERIPSRPPLSMELMWGSISGP